MFPKIEIVFSVLSPGSCINLPASTLLMHHLEITTTIKETKTNGQIRQKHPKTGKNKTKKTHKNTQKNSRMAKSTPNKRNIYTAKSSDRRLASGKKAELYLLSASSATVNVSNKLNPKHFRLFVGNIGPDTTEAILSAAFAKYSSISYVKVPLDAKTKENKGFGFVAFASSDDYLKAFKEMNGKYVGLRPVQLKRAEGKPR